MAWQWIFGVVGKMLLGTLMFISKCLLASLGCTLGLLPTWEPGLSPGLWFLITESVANIWGMKQHRDSSLCHCISLFLFLYLSLHVSLSLSNQINVNTLFKFSWIIPQVNGFHIMVMYHITMRIHFGKGIIRKFSHCCTSQNISTQAKIYAITSQYNLTG